MKTQTTDPYAPPPLKKDWSAWLVRGTILVGLLAAAGAAAYAVMDSPPARTAAVERPQNLADQAYRANRRAPPAPAPPAPKPPGGAPSATTLGE